MLLFLSDDLKNVKANFKKKSFLKRRKSLKIAHYSKGAKIKPKIKELSSRLVKITHLDFVS
jgi:hypothetical protein